MTKPRGPVLQTQTAHTTKKTVLALAAILILQVAALAAPFDTGWSSAGTCWCYFDSSDPLIGDGLVACVANECKARYSGKDEDDCESGGAAEYRKIIGTNVQPACMGRSF